MLVTRQPQYSGATLEGHCDARLPRPAAMRPLPKARRLLAALSFLPLAGCNLGPNYHRPAFAVPARFVSPAPAGPVWPARGWWHGFGSATLDRLMAAARAHNFDIRAAVAQMLQANAQATVAGAPLLPAVGGGPNGSWQKGSSRSSSGGLGTHPGGTYSRQFQLGFNVSYELDLWGKNRAALQSAKASLLASRFNRETVALTVESSVATTWFTALALEDRLAIATQNLADARAILAAVQGQLAAGTTTALAIAQQQALVAAEAATIPNFRSQIRQEVLALGILVGQPPEAISVPTGTLRGLHFPPVAPGLPSALLRRRPDVAAAEATLIADNANVKSARAALFPSISLTGSGGWQSLALNTLFSPGSTFGTLAASLTQTIFDNGAKAGQVALARGQYAQALALYEKSVVQAFTDVETALTAYRYATTQERLQARAVAVAQTAATIARAQLAAGTTDITTVLSTEQTLLSDEDTLAQIRLSRILALVSLYKALGGGWQAPAAPAAS